MLKVKVAILTFLLWLVGCALYCYWYITSILAQLIHDAYAKSETFQFIMFMLFRFPFLLMALPLVIYIEVIICEFFIKSKENN
jgi:hypothetical protein